MSSATRYRPPERTLVSRICSLVLVSSVLILPDARAQNGAWTLKTQLSAARGASSACVVDGRIYVIGGTTSSPFSGLGDNEVYDPSLNTWETNWPMPTPRGWLSSAVVNDTFYAIGGDWPMATDIVEAYDPVTDTWATKQSMLSPRRAAQAGVVDGIVYNVGGNTTERSCEAYDPATNTWTSKPMMPGSGGDVAVTVYNGLVYTFGGGMDNISYNNVYAFDPRTDTWSPKRDMPTARFAFQTYLVGGKIYAVGGCQTRATTLNTVEAYDPVNDTWETLENMPGKLAWFSGAVVDGRIYVIGGSKDFGKTSTADVWEYDPAFTHVAQSSELPAHFVLEQNYPNPFNPTTVISYQLPVTGEVHLAVYDLLGREVGVLVHGKKEAGVHQVMFDASGLAGGVYFYRLQAGNLAITRRSMLLQ